MSEVQAWRIQQLEEQVKDLEKEIVELKSLRDQLLGMSTLAKWGLRALFLLAGTGGVSIVHWIVRWLNAPMGVAKP